MAKIDLPYVQLCRTKGRDYGYYRRAGIRQRIPGAVGSPEWLSAYRQIHEAAESRAAAPLEGPTTVPGSLRALWLAYRASPEWRSLGNGTQKAYQGLIEPILPKVGDQLLAALTGEWLIRSRDKYAETPSKANHFLAVMKLLLNWGVPRGWLKVSPAAGVKRLKHTPKSHRAWSDTEVAAMTGPDVGGVALPILLALHTGQRLGDVLKLPWSAWDGQGVTVAAQGKTGARVYVPALPELRAALDAAPRRAIVICTRRDGHAWKADHFKHSFAAARDRLKLAPDLHFHGLRHLAGKRLAEAGCTPQEIAAILGHKTLGMVSLYTAQAGQEHLARAAITKLAEHNRKRSVKQGKKRV